MRDFAMNYLQEHYRGIDVHTNSWSGLDGIVLLMHTLIVVIYLVATVFIMVSVALISGKLLQAETAILPVSACSSFPEMSATETIINTVATR